MKLDLIQIHHQLISQKLTCSFKTSSKVGSFWRWSWQHLSLVNRAQAYTTSSYNGIMFKTSQQLHISSLWFSAITVFILSNRELTLESAVGRNTDDGRWLEGAVVNPSHMKRHLYHQEIAITQLNRLTNLFLFVMKPWFFSLISSFCLFLTLLVSPPLIIALVHVDFSFSRHSYPFPLPFHPSVIPLVFPTPCIPAPLHPDRHSNSLSLSTASV